jgi:ParB-like chromosome segregation protein Spo0J
MVTNGGTGDKSYTLKAGFHRMEVLSRLKWGSKDVPVIVVSANESPTAGLVENIVRNDMTVLEVAGRVTHLIEGTYKVADGETAVAHDKKALQATLGFSQSHMGNLLRLAKSLSKEVRDKVKNLDVPSRFLFAWAAIENEEKQLAACEAWLALQAEQEKMGTKGKHKKKSSKGEGEGEGGGGKPGKKMLSEEFDVLCFLANEVYKGTEKAVVEAKRDAVGFMLGTLKKRPTTADERKTYERALKEAAKAEAAEEEAEEDEE